MSTPEWNNKDRAQDLMDNAESLGDYIKAIDEAEARGEATGIQWGMNKASNIAGKYGEENKTMCCCVVARKIWVQAKEILEGK